jgi:hypothetical protein
MIPLRPLGWVDVDYRSSQIGEDHGDGRSSDLLTEVDNANADEWKLRLFLHGLLPLKIVFNILLNYCHSVISARSTFLCRPAVFFNPDPPYFSCRLAVLCHPDSPYFVIPTRRTLSSRPQRRDLSQSAGDPSTSLRMTSWC